MRFILPSLLLALSTLPLLANGGGYSAGVDFTGDIAPFTPTGTEHVQIVDEKLDILLQPKSAKVSIRYILKNDHKRKVVTTIGFPIEEIFDEHAHWFDVPKKDKTKLAYCKNYSIKFNGQDVKATYQNEPYGKAGGKKFKGHEQYLGINGWLVSKLRIPANSKAILEITYDSDYQESKMWVSDDYRFSGAIFNYRLSTGGVWKSTIKTGIVTVSSIGLEQDWIEFSNPVNRFKKVDSKWVWEFNELYHLAKLRRHI